MPDLALAIARNARRILALARNARRALALEDDAADLAMVARNLADLDGRRRDRSPATWRTSPTPSRILFDALPIARYVSGRS